MLEPSDERDLADAVAAATGPLSIRGGGTRGGRERPGEVLSVAGLSGIELYEPGALTVVARAGTPLRDIEAALSAESQRFPFEPMDHRALLGTAGEPTIGGVVAGNVSGPRRVVAGACRDSLIGVRFVDGSGTVVKNGGRVMKNVTGYDLVKLMAGSFGTLGVLSEVGFKVLPAPPAAASLSLPGHDVPAAVRAMAAALGSPFEVTGAAHLDGITHLRIEGFETSVAYRAGRLAETLAPHGAAAIEDDPVAVGALWRDIRDVACFAGRAGDVWRVSVKPSDAPPLLERLGNETFAPDGPSRLLDWGGGLIWLRLVPGTDLRAALGRFGGHATLVRGRGAPRFQPEPGPVAAISAGLRAKFDPRGILNPGLMG